MKQRYFNKTDILIWSISVSIVMLSFIISPTSDILNLITSLIGVTSLIFCAKGNPIGQALIVVFSSLYGIISLRQQYYGELITYAGMTLPMAILSLISWIKNPYKGNKSEVEVNRINIKDIKQCIVFTLLVTFLFYFILDWLDTANLIPSTISVTTSFLAVFLTYKRSPFYAIAYAVNDIVLIVLWMLATVKDITYISVVMCFVAFLINDIYGFISWNKMYKRQNIDS